MNLFQLKTLLGIYNIDWNIWERTIEDLFLEVERGETTFSIGKDGLIRHVHVARAMIWDENDHQLIELEQTLVNGKVRHRNFPPSGKLIQGEEADIGIFRELKEEIGFDPHDFISVKARAVHTEKKVAPSYAGLMSVFTYHDYDMKLRPEARKNLYEKTEEDGTRIVFGWK